VPNEQREEELTEILKTARYHPPSGWQERALELMARARPARRGSNLQALAVAAGAAIALLALGLFPYSPGFSRGTFGRALAAQQAIAEGALAEQPVARNRQKASPADVSAHQSPTEKILAPYRQRAPSFVRAHYPGDAAMLMAAGLLVEDADTGRRLLREAAEMGRKPAAWAAYAGRLMKAAPHYDRIGISGADPEDAKAMAQAERRIRESRPPAKLSQRDVAPLLRAFRDWQAADAKNAMPVALEAYYLYGLHRDAEALAAWQRAASLPQATDYYQERTQAVARLLSAMGMPEREAASAAIFSSNLPFYNYSRSCARIATYEGRLAQMNHNPEEAIRLWNATMAFGRRMQDSADAVIGFLVGVAVEGIGASPSWKLSADRTSGIPGGPLGGLRYFYGPQHGFYVSQVGELADSRVRDSLIRARVRVLLLANLVSEGIDAPLVESGLLLGLSGLTIGLLAALLVVFAAISIRLRRQADEATELRVGAQITILVFAFIPWVYAGIAAYWSLMHQWRVQGLLGAALIGYPLTFLAMLLLPLLAARFSRLPSARLAAAWRGNLRRILPLAVASLAIAALALGIAGKNMERKWAREWYAPGYSEMKSVIRLAGPAWTNPKIPADAWRAERPPR
jgi:hypothetical protein